MQRALLAIFLIVIFERTIAQQPVPTINATSGKVDIRVGNDYFSKGGWILEPGKNPDIFSIGSKWPYKSKKVTFITDRDSISFDVQTGQHYDFIILKDGTPCHIQIRTLQDPVFLNTKAVLLIGAGLFILLLILYATRKLVRVRQLLSFGYFTVILFWIMTFVSGYVHGNYNQLKNTISELGAIGTRSELFTSCFLLFLAALNIIFCIGFYRASKVRRISLIPSILSFAMPVTMIWAGIFTLGNEFHSMLGMLPFFIIIGNLLSYFLWKDQNNLQRLRTASLLAFIVMMLLLTRFIKPFGYHFEGLVQRFYYLGWSIWTIGISYYLSQDSKTNNH